MITWWCLLPVAVLAIGVLLGWQVRGILADREEERLWRTRQPRDDAPEDRIDRSEHEEGETDGS